MATQHDPTSVGQPASNVAPQQPASSLSAISSADSSNNDAAVTTEPSTGNTSAPAPITDAPLSNLSSFDSHTDAKNQGDASNVDAIPNSKQPLTGAVEPSPAVKDVIDSRALSETQDETSSDNAKEASIAALIRQVSDMKNELERMMARMSPGDTKRHNLALNQLHDAFKFCASKVPETVAEVPTSPTPEPAPSIQHYMDTLPTGPIENMLRYFSSRPRIADWPKHITPRDAELLYLDQGPMGEAFRRQCTDVEISCGITSSTRAADILLNPREQNAQTNKVIEVAGKFFTKLTYHGDRDENSAPHLISWIEPYRLHCTSVVHLALTRVHVRYLTDILEARSGKLESITLDSYSSSRSHLYVVSKHGKGVKKLSICPGANAPEMLWHTVGPTLEELEIPLPMKPPPPGMAKFGLKYAKEHCKALKRLIMPKDTVPHELEDLIKSLGDQLEFCKANFVKMQYQQVSAIGNACPNATFELTSTVKLDVIMALHYRVPSLKFSKAMLDPVPDSFFESYTNIKTLSISMPDGDTCWFLSNLLREPKPNLAEVSITFMQENPAELLDLLIKVTTLTKLKLWTRTLPVEGLEKVVKRNKKLNKLTLKSRTMDMRLVRQVLRMCRDCEELAELRISKMSHLAPPPPSRMGSVETVSSSTAYEIARTADECVAFKHRNTFVQILGVDYVF